MPLLPLAFSPDARRLAIGRTDATVLLLCNPFGPASDVASGGAGGGVAGGWVAGAGPQLLLHLRAEPNPIRGGSSGTSGTTLRFDLAGGGARSLRWDGRDDTGARVPAGFYFVRVKAGKAERATRVVVME